MLINSYHPLQSSHSITTRTLFKQLTFWLGSAIANLLLVEPDAETRIIQAEEQNSELLWEVYEPIAGQILYRRLRMK